ncbi:hypothetical protein HKW90_03200 [Pseudomonas aeruginosa]|jgi:hypothetical protein|uniref:hypothetical protein n=1 Tax=Pseudomonas aeruginosa TaxID=287 RepID=UPI000B9A6096|nr:hypothetical protein [Pseudomonas aeruginosa]MBF3053411.1 hypothetical protein [Pseudomonas aeruginosa]MDC9027119.1 hypothetical protein [Pseudomonas aeruginosa]OXT77176.1 hypothetical protein CF344_01810 [Pseudomonas aeruginosa]TQI24201.1 hypothetical protein FLI93_00605 [Pseudomonas aeruginosa]
MLKGYGLALLALAATSAAFGAEMNKWTSFNDRTPSGTPVCSMVVTPSAGEAVKNFAIKAMGGANHLSVTLYKDSWKIPKGKSVQANIDFMDNYQLAVDGYGDGKILDLALPASETASFILNIRDAKKLRISFPSGSEQPWVASLDGAKSLLLDFVNCADSQEHTQPF